MDPGTGVTFPASRTLLIGFSSEWEGTTKLGYTDVLVVRKIDCGNWLAREYMPAHQRCALFYPLDCGLEGYPLNKGRPLVLWSGTVFWVLTPVAGPIFEPPSARLIEGFQFENCLISRFYFLPNLVGKEFPTKEYLTRIRTFVENVLTVSFPKRNK